MPVSEGDYVVLSRTYDPGNTKIVCVQHDTIVHYGKLHFYTNNLIGCEYGSTFEIIDGKLEKINNFVMYNNDLSTMLSTKMPAFEHKSDFSKEKIMKKKKKQSHANVLTMTEPKLDILHEMLYSRGKIGGFRIDLLSQTITFANIQNGSKCLLLDHNLGILTAAVLSRFLPDGLCVQLVASPESIHTTRKSLDMLNFKELDYKDHLFAITIHDAIKVYDGCDDFEQEENHPHSQSKKFRFEERDDYDDNDSSMNSVEICEQQLKNAKRDQKRKAKSLERQQAATLLRSKCFDSLIIFVQYECPLSLLRILLSFIGPSRQLTIYSDTREPLLDCFDYLKTNLLAIDLIVSDSWYRKYQVLPDRTRPDMNMTGYGGYLLTGTSVKI